MTAATSDTPFIRRPKPPHLQRRIKIVAAMRLILPAIAALLLATLALWSRFGLDTTSFRLSMDGLDLNSLNTLSMSNLDPLVDSIVNSFERGDEYFNFTAISALRPPPKP